MAKSRNKKNQKARSEKRNMKAARETMHQMKRNQNLSENISNFMKMMKEYAGEKGDD